MKPLRLVKLFSVPWRMLYAALYPVQYAKRIGVQCRGEVTIYGSSYRMFSAEPYLVTLGDNVFISVGATFVCHDGSTLPFRRQVPGLELAGQIVVGDNVFVGMGALILPNVRIGSNCIVGAHAVVTKDVPDGAIVAGNPARIVSSTHEFLERAKVRSLQIGHLTGKAKVRAYKSIFGLK